MKLPKLFENSSGYSPEVTILYRKRDRTSIESIINEYSRIIQTSATHLPPIWLHRINKYNHAVTKGCIRPKDKEGKWSVHVGRLDGFAYECVAEAKNLHNALDLFIELEGAL